MIPSNFFSIVTPPPLVLRAYLLTLIAELFLEEGEILSDVAHVIELFKTVFSFLMTLNLLSNLFCLGK